MDNIILDFQNISKSYKSIKALSDISFSIPKNSIFGILGQLTKELVFNEIINYWTLFLFVLIGGLIGNYINLKIFSNRVLAIITSFLVIFVAMRIGYKIFI